MKSTTRRVGTPVALATVATLLSGITTWGAASAAQAQETSLSGSDTHTYITVTTGGVTAMSTLEATAERFGATDVTSYDEVGAAVVTMTESEAAALEARPGILVSRDARITADPIDTSAVKRWSDLTATAAAASWGLDRVDQRSGALDGQYNSPAGDAGAGVHVWVFDSGIALDHPEFAGRIGTSYDFVGDGYGAYDCKGHGTHVAGTIASNRLGVAPQAILHSVRILDCDGVGTYSGFLAALNTVAAVAPAASVANASLGGAYDPTVNAAVANFVARSGMPLVVAAGNAGKDVAGFSPASAPQATTVAASEQHRDNRDYQAVYSNYGAGVDVYAPGTDIWSTYYLDPAYKYLSSGTSMAAPHVAGYYALYFSAHPSATVGQADAALRSQATVGAVRNPAGVTPNRLVYTSAAASATPAPRPVVVGVAKAGYGNVLAVNVNPDRGSASYAFRVQKRASNGSWATLGPVYRTEGAAETKSITLPAGVYRVAVPAADGYAAATSSAVALTAPVARVGAGRDSARSKLKVDVNPDKGTGYWKFTVQKKTSSGWKSLSTYKTKGSSETRTVNLKAGTYRVVVAGKFGYIGAASAPVTLVK